MTLRNIDTDRSDMHELGNQGPSAKPHVKHSFSTAGDFAAVLLFPVVGASLFLLKHYLQFRGVPAPIDAIWFNRFWAFDTSLWAHLLSFTMLIGGVGAAVFLVHLIDKLRKWEETHSSIR